MTPAPTARELIEAARNAALNLQDPDLSPDDELRQYRYQRALRDRAEASFALALEALEAVVDADERMRKRDPIAQAALLIAFEKSIDALAAMDGVTHE